MRHAQSASKLLVETGAGWLAPIFSPGHSALTETLRPSQGRAYTGHVTMRSMMAGVLLILLALLPGATQACALHCGAGANAAQPLGQSRLRHIRQCAMQPNCCGDRTMLTMCNAPSHAQDAMVRSSREVLPPAITDQLASAAPRSGATGNAARPRTSASPPGDDGSGTQSPLRI